MPDPLISLVTGGLSIRVDSTPYSGLCLGHVSVCACTCVKSVASGFGGLCVSELDASEDVITHLLTLISAAW